MPLYALSIAGALAVAPQLFEPSNEDLLTTLQDEDPSVLAALGGLWVLELAAFALAVAACLAALAGDAVSGRGALAVTLPRSGPLVGLAIVYAGVTAAGLALWIVPGVWIGTLWALALPALVLERTSVGAALSRSRDLVRGRFWPILGVLALAFVGVLVVSLLLGGVAGALATAVAGEGKVAGAFAALAAGIVGNVVSAPVMAAVLLIVHRDRRARLGGVEEPVREEPAVRAFGGWQPPVAPGSERTRHD